MLRFPRWIIEKIGTPSADMALRAVEKILPETVARFTPRLYKETERYHNPRRLITGLVGTAASVNLMGGFPDSITQLTYAALARLLDQDVPTLFIAPELLQALYLTDLPVEEDWTRIHLPYEAAVFVFPRGALKHPAGYEIEGIIYARLKKGERLSWPQTDIAGWPTVMELNDRFVVATYVPSLFQAFTQNLTGDIMPFIPQHPEQIEGYLLEGVNLTNIFGDQDILRLEENEKAMMNQLTALVFSILLYMLARPEEVAQGAIVRRVKPRQGNARPREFWTPNIVGFRYQKRATTTGETGETAGTGRSVRPHWRRGHFRMQPHGPQRSARRVIWIEPTFVGGK